MQFPGYSIIAPTATSSGTFAGQGFRVGSAGQRKDFLDRLEGKAAR